MAYICCVEGCTKTAFYKVGKRGYCSIHKERATEHRVRAVKFLERNPDWGKHKYDIAQKTHQDIIERQKKHE